MKIIACLKVIADPDIVDFDVVNENLRNLYPAMDPLSYHVLEEGLRLREKHGGEVTALSVAPEKEEAILRNALLFGVDRAIRIWNDQLEEADTFLVSQVLKGEIRNIGGDLILCGVRSSDYGSEFMASTLAHSLNIPSATHIVNIEIDNYSGLTAHKKLQKGGRETYTLKLPAILGLEQGINEPRYVAPFSKTYNEGRSKKVEFVEPRSVQANPLIAILGYTQSKPRVKVGIDVSALSMEERLKMMRGELGGTKVMFEGSPEIAAQKICAQLNEFLE